MKLHISITTSFNLLTLAFILHSFFVYNPPVLLGEDPLLEEAEKCDKFSKPGFDRDKAVKLYKQYAEKETTDNYNKILAYHRIAQLYSYAAGPGNKDSTKARKYYNHILHIAGDKVMIDVLYAKSNLTSIGKKTHEERLIEDIRFHAWIIQVLLDPELEQKMLFPSDIKESEKKDYTEGVIDSLLSFRESEAKTIKGLANNVKDPIYKQMLNELFSPFVTLDSQKGAVRSFLEKKIKAEKPQEDSGLKRNSDESEWEKLQSCEKMLSRDKKEGGKRTQSLLILVYTKYRDYLEQNPESKTEQVKKRIKELEKEMKEAGFSIPDYQPGT